MELVLIVLAVVSGTAAAVRSTWSPCGLSMLSTVTPLAEAGRGRRWGVTATWFVLGAVLGGLLTGGVVALLAVGLSAAGLGAAGALVAAAVLAAAAVALDVAPTSSRLAIPHHRRQVNEDWLVQFRGWVYGGGFGLQIGTGLATYIMTAAVYLTFALAALTADPAVALALVVWFALVRGLAILAGAGLTSPDRLVAFHRRMDALTEPVRRAVVAVEVVVAGVALGAVAGVLAGVALGVVLAAVAVALTARRQRTSSPAPAPAPVASDAVALPTA